MHEHSSSSERSDGPPPGAPPAPGALPTLTVVIPALDEEEAIGSTIARCLAAREGICREAGLEAVEVIVVSDGSTDRTVEIARSHAEVEVVVFEQNRGYGAAIQEGFRRGRGALVGFLDADGTCDPATFGPLCRTLLSEGGDVVLGSRLGAGSRMPRVRRLGNRAFAFILGLTCGRSVTDTASGMRVLRREALAELEPLPAGLHFTPAMSARALLAGQRVLEVPMSYAERVGESKLSVVKDGVRFLRVILESLLWSRPERPFLALALASGLVGLLLAAHPVEHYLNVRRVEEWMVYRFVACFLLGAVGWLFVSSAAVAHRMTTLRPRRRDADTFWPPIVAWAMSGRRAVLGACSSTAFAMFLLWPGLVEYATTGGVTLHWSRVVVGAWFLLGAVQLVVTAVLIHVLHLWKSERRGRGGE